MGRDIEGGQYKGHNRRYNSAAHHASSRALRVVINIVLAMVLLGLSFNFSFRLGDWLIDRDVQSGYMKDIRTVQDDLFFCQENTLLRAVNKEREVKVDGLLGLVERRAPLEDVGLISFELVATLENCANGECFQVLKRQHLGAVRIVGTTLSSLSYGLDQFYRVYCGTQLLSWASRGNRPKLGCVERFVEDEEAKAIAGSSNVQYRYYLNQVTWSYSMAWWGWDRWQEELDWMALHGINLALAHVGQEAIWFRVWNQLLDGKFEASKFFTGIAYLSWHRMGNLQRLGHPFDVDKYLSSQLALQHQILGRMGELGISPILPAFNLHVPRQIEPLVTNFTYSSYWSGFQDDRFSGLMRLDPTDPMVSKISQMFVAEQLQEFSDEIAMFKKHYFSVDTFNEMDPGNVNVAAAAKAVFDPVHRCDPLTMLVVQMWAFAHNPDDWPPYKVKAFMEAVPQERVLYLDLHGEKRPQWRRLRPILDKEPIIWTYLHNFGGTKGMAGEINWVHESITKALVESKNVQGIGIAMEGIEHNELVFEHVLSHGWTMDFDVGEWALTRYHARNESQTIQDLLVSAWKCSLETVYDRPPNLIGWGNTKSIVELRPGFRMEKGGFQPTKIAYAPNHFKNCTISLFDGLKLVSEKDSPVALQTLAYDVVDFAKQVISDAALEVAREIDRIYQHHHINNKVEMKAYGTEMLVLIKTMGEILNQHWLWRNVFTKPDIDASHITSADFKDLKTMVLPWSWETKFLHSYASRLAADVVLDVYLPRWEAWIDAVLLEVGPRSIRISNEYKHIENQWIRQHFDPEDQTATKDVNVPQLLRLIPPILK